MVSKAFKSSLGAHKSCKKFYVRLLPEGYLGFRQGSGSVLDLYPISIYGAYSVRPISLQCLRLCVSL